MQGLSYLQENLCSHGFGSIQVFHPLDSLTSSVDVFNKSQGLLLPFSVCMNNLKACGLYQSDEKINTWVIKPYYFAEVNHASGIPFDFLLLPLFHMVLLTLHLPTQKLQQQINDKKFPHIYMHICQHRGVSRAPCT